MAEKQLTESINANGSALQENEVYLRSWDAKSKQLSANIADFWTNAINTDVIKNIIDVISKLVDILDILINNSFSSFLIQTTLLTTALYGLGIAFNALKNTAIANEIAFYGLMLAEEGLIATTRTLTATLLASPLFWTVVASAGIFAIVKGIDALSTSSAEAKQQLEQLRNTITTLSDDLKNIEDLQQSYDELSKKENKSAEDKQQLLQVTKDLSDIFPGVVSLYDAEGNAIEINSQKLDKYIKLKREELNLKKEELASNFVANRQQLGKSAINKPSIADWWGGKTTITDWFSGKSTVETLQTELDKYEQALLKLKTSKQKNIRVNGILVNREELEDEIANTRTLLNNALRDQRSNIEEYKRGLKASLDINDDFKNLNQNALSSFIETIGDNLNKLSTQGNKVDGLDFSESLGNSDEFISKMNEINKQFEINKDNVNLTEKQYKQWRKEAVKSLSDVLLYEGKLGSRKLADDLAKGMIDGLGEIQVATNKAKDSLTEYEKALSDFQAIYKDNASKIKDLKGFLDEINDKGLTQSSISKIISDYQDYIPLLENESELRKQLVKDTEDYQNAIYDAFAKTKQEDTNFYNSIKNNNKSLFDNLSNFYKNDVSNWTTLAQAKITINSSLIKTLGDQWEKYFSAFQAGETISYSEYNKLSGMSKLKDSRTPLPDSVIQQFKLLDELNKAARKQAEAFKNLNVSSGLGKSSSSSSKSFEKTFEVWKEALEAINIELETLKDQLDDVTSFEQKTQIYDQMILLLEKKQNLLLEISKTFDSNLQQAEQKLRSYIGKGLSESDFNKIMFGSTDTIEVDIKNEKIAKAIEDFKKLKDSAEGLKKEIQGIDDEIRDLSFAEFKINLSIEDNKLSDLTQEKENLRNEMSLLEKGSAEYIALLEKENQINIESVNILRNKIALTQQELASDRYNADQKKELIDTLKQLKQEYVNLQFSIKQQLASVADEIIQIYKNIYEKQKQAALNALDEQMKAEERRHKRATDNIDDELKQFENYINAKLKALDKEENEHDYNRELEKKQKAILETQKNIDILSLDDSWEAKAKREELIKQLAQQEDEITEYQHDHSIDLRKDNLKDQLDVYKKDIDAKKRAEDTKLNLEKDRLDRIKRETERYYDELINDERKFAQIKTDILNGNIDEVKNAFGSFKTFVNSNLEFIGNSITANLITKMEQALALLQNVSGMDSSIPDLGDTTNTPPSNSNRQPKTIIDSNMYENYNGTAILPSRTIAGLLGASVDWEGYGDNQTIIIGGKRFKPTKNVNGTAYLSIRQVAEALGHQVEWDEKTKQIRIYHDGGIVGNESFGFVDKFNKFFNTSANEHIIKALTNEILIPPKNITKFLIPNMQKLIANATPQLQFAGGGGNVTYNMNVHIDKVENTDKGIDSFFKRINNGMSKLGK